MRRSERGQAIVLAILLLAGAVLLLVVLALILASKIPGI